MDNQESKAKSIAEQVLNGCAVWAGTRDQVFYFTDLSQAEPVSIDMSGETPVISQEFLFGWRHYITTQNDTPWRVGGILLTNQGGPLQGKGPLQTGEGRMNYSWSAKGEAVLGCRYIVVDVAENE